MFQILNSPIQDESSIHTAPDIPQVTLKVRGQLKVISEFKVRYLVPSVTTILSKKHQSESQRSLNNDCRALVVTPEIPSLRAIQPCSSPLRIGTLLAIP